MLPKKMLHVVTTVALLVLGGDAQAATGAKPRLAVVFDPTAASLPQAEIRTAIAAELGAVLVDDPTSADGVLSVARGDSGRIVVTYRPLQATVARAVPEPKDSTDTPALVALVAGNLIRNEALELIAAPPTRPEPALVPPFPPAHPPAELVSPFPPKRATSVRRPPALAPPPPASPGPAIRQSHAGDQDTPRTRRLFLMAGIGSGVGLSRGTPDMNPNYLDGTSARKLRFSGTSREAGYHLAPELAFLWRPDVVIGAQLRLQHVRGASEVHHPSCGSTGVCRPPSTAFALLGRVGWLRPVHDKVLLLVSGVAGLGRVRHLVSLEAVVDPTCGDTGSTPASTPCPAAWCCSARAWACFTRRARASGCSAACRRWAACPLQW